MKTFANLSLLLAGLWLSACTSGNHDAALYESSEYADQGMVVNKNGTLYRMDAQSETPAEPEAPVNKKQLIKDGRLGIRTSELERTKSFVDSLVAREGGYYASEVFNNDDYQLSWNLRVRIPAPRFEAFIARLEGGGNEILYKEINTRDVTDQFIDLNTRLETKKGYLQRYKQLLNQAKNVKEILEIEEKIRLLEEEIDSTTGRLNYLSDQVAYSTLDLNLSKQKAFTYKPGHRDSYRERLKQSLSKGWYAFIDFSLFVIRLWPFWLLAIPTVYLWRKFRRRNKPFRFRE
ncbi:MAG: DUF4349 domain-containing protein [Bacteroidetes bacterium HGW-Bacteroidetes-4]|jgi:uncharacterized small protein (DUF1192 family)|nr:MAG: DUF4349 domain-containing protein [Bacteroidetes bacterium HGW-Bacteroidetes-4]